MKSNTAAMAQPGIALPAAAKNARAICFHAIGAVTQRATDDAQTATAAVLAQAGGNLSGNASAPPPPRGPPHAAITPGIPVPAMGPGTDAVMPNPSNVTENGATMKPAGLQGSWVTQLTNVKLTTLLKTKNGPVVGANVTS
jgi:hypothetical protein